MNIINMKKKLYVCALFTFGLFYYLIFPVLFSDYYMSNDLPLSIYIGKLFFRFDYTSYYLYVLTLFVFFTMGVFCLSSESKYLAIKTKKTEGFIFFTLMLVFLFLLFNYFQLKDQLFKGYAGLNWNEKNDQKSLVSGFNIFLGAFTVYLWVEEAKTKWFSTMLTLMNSVILLGLGGRMYVLVVLICILTYCILYKNISLKKILIFTLCAFFFLLIMGVIRQGGNLTGKSLFFVFIAEPMFNWLSAGSTIRFNTLHLFEMPDILVSSAVSMIPTLLWSGKSEFLNSLASNSYLIDSPVGGTNILASLLSSFGIIGSFLAMFIFGLFAGFLIKKSKKNSFHFMMLSIFCALMPFMFFRDNVVIFQKNLFFNGMLLPYLILKINDLLGKSKKNP